MPLDGSDFSLPVLNVNQTPTVMANKYEDEINIRKPALGGSAYRRHAAFNPISIKSFASSLYAQHSPQNQTDFLQP